MKLSHHWWISHSRCMGYNSRTGEYGAYIEEEYNSVYEISFDEVMEKIKNDSSRNHYDIYWDPKTNAFYGTPYHQPLDSVKQDIARSKIRHFANPIETSEWNPFKPEEHWFVSPHWRSIDDLQKLLMIRAFKGARAYFNMLEILQTPEARPPWRN